MTAAAAVSGQHSLDSFLDGRVTLLQPLSGHRAGLDAALLQALVPADAQGHAVDLGTGVGTVALSIASRAPGLTITGVERDSDLVACARGALGLPQNSAFAARIHFFEADVTDRRAARESAGLADGSANWVLMNPPFDVHGSVRASPDPARRSAHVAEAGALGEWCRTAAGLLRGGGKLGVIHRATALPALLQSLEGRFGDLRILPVHPSSDSAASRVLLLAVRGSRAGLRLLPGLVLHADHGQWTPEADAILRGQREIAI